MIRSTTPLLAVLLLVAPTSSPRLGGAFTWADDDDDDDPVEEESAPPIEGCLRLVGQGRDEEGLGFLAQHDQRRVTRLALKLIGTSNDVALVIGAGAFLGLEATRQTTPPGEDWAAALRRRLPALEERLASFSAAIEQDRARLVPEQDLAERVERRTRALIFNAALVEALAACGGPEDQTLALVRVRDDELELARAAARGVCRAGQQYAHGRLFDLVTELETRTRDAEERLRGGFGEFEEGSAELASAEDAVTRSQARLSVVMETLTWFARSSWGCQAFVRAVIQRPDSLTVCDVLTEIRRPVCFPDLQRFADSLLDSEEGARRALGLRLLTSTGALLDGEDLDDLLRDEDSQVQLAAIQHCYRRVRRAAYPTLIDLLDDPDPAVGDAAHGVLKRIAGKPIPRRRAAWQIWLKDLEGEGLEGEGLEGEDR